MSSIVVCDYGAGNTHSVLAALSRVGLSARLSSDPEAITTARHVVLPGVGSARQAMNHLDATGASTALRERFTRGGAILGICLGLQLALESSDEDGGVSTLGLMEGRVVRLGEGRIPRIGWAVVEPWGDCYYFAHSYACETSARVATSDGVTAAVTAGSFVGVQFHPEKSGPSGSEWLSQCLSPA